MKRREVVLELVVSPEEIMSREVELGCERWTFFCFKLLLNSGATDILRQQLRGTLVAAQWRGDTALTLPLFWRRSTASSVFRVGARGLAFSLSPPSPTVPIPNKPPRFCGRKAKWLFKLSDNV